MSIRHFALAAGLGLAVVAAFAQTAPRKGYIVQLVDPPAAAYTGGVAGIAATRPAAGQRLDTLAGNFQDYVRHLESKSSAVLTTVPAAQVYHRYSTVFNGFAAQLTDAEMRKLAATSGVVSITADDARPLDTSYTPSFIGVSNPGGAWSRGIKGEGVVIAHIDGGVWPESPSFSDKVDANGKPIASHLPGNLAYNPLPQGRYKGICQASVGNASFNASMCNNKLVGASFFNAGWKANRTPAQEWALEYQDSPRDADGHGSHTLSTAGGNEGVVTNSGIVMSGIAPRARVAAYRTCYVGVNGPGVSPSGCFPSDSIAAINQAVADGADVINYSISGSQTSFRDPVEDAFRGAAAAGVFVATSAGNTGPANTVAHNSPWLMTVGNSTHDRFLGATLTLGNGAQFIGASFQNTGLASTPMILSTEAGLLPLASLTANEQNALRLCFNAADRANAGLLGTTTPNAALDPAKVAGKVVVCDRGTNDRVNKSAEVLAAGGVGMVLINTSANTLNADLHSVPSIHLAHTDRTAVRTYAAGGAGTGAFSIGRTQVPGFAFAPVMNNSSSRGPNRADADVMKPDITGPGTDILAAVSAPLSLADRNAVMAGTLIPPQAEANYTGTSMSSPHVAGAGALLKQAKPGWSPYAIKSALMTSALQSVKLANGTPDPSYFGYGAGHLNPNGALDTDLVYDTSNADHAAYFNGAIGGAALNLASMARGTLVGTTTFNRTLANKGASAITVNASSALTGFNVVVNPASLTIPAGASRSFSVTLTRTSATVGTYAFGHLTWTDASNPAKTVRSPIQVKPENIVALGTVSDTRNVGTKIVTVQTGFTGPFSAAPTGLTPATRFTGSIATGGQACFPFNVAAGAKVLRAQVFDSETSSPADIDLYLFQGNTQIGASEGNTSDESLQFLSPTAGGHTACVVGFNTFGVSVNYTVNVFVVGPAASVQTLKVFAPANVVSGGLVSVGASWNVPAGNRYLGLIEFSNPPSPVLARTFVEINATGAVPVPTASIAADAKALR